MNPNHHPPEGRHSLTRLLLEGLEFVVDVAFEIVGGLLELLSTF